MATTPVLLPGEFHGQRSLAGYSPWGRKESDNTEVTEHVIMYLLSIDFNFNGTMSEWTMHPVCLSVYMYVYVCV